MKLSDNERKMLQAINDNVFSTISQVTQHCGFSPAQGYHYFRSLSLGGLLDGFELTYLGYKMLSGQQIEPDDAVESIAIRTTEKTPPESMS